MTNPLSVNYALSQLQQFDGEPVELEGILEVDSEGYELLHYPKAERRSQVSAGLDEYRSAVWVAHGNGSLRLNHAALERWLGKRVRIHGILTTIASLTPIGSVGRGGFGPWGFWPAQIEPYSIQRVSAEERRANEA